jgi:translation initiation factor RLI1
LNDTSPACTRDRLDVNIKQKSFRAASGGKLQVLATAMTMYREMDMGFFLEHGEADVRPGQKSIGPSP